MSLITTSSSVVIDIPQDIIDSIIAEIDDSHSLKTCALVSSSFLLPSRKRLFAEIYLLNEQACQRLHQFLVKNPVVQSFVRTIICVWGSLDYNAPRSSLVSFLRLPFCCLESFAWAVDGSDWNDFSSELKDALSAIVNSSTLKSLEVSTLDNMPITLLQGIHLPNLKLFSSFFNLNGEELRPGTASEGVANPASRTVIDQCLWCFNNDPAPRGLPETKFLPFLCYLRVFDIYVKPCSVKIRCSFDILSFIIRSLRVSLSSPATLEQLKIHITFYATDNPLNPLRVADVWRHLDSFVTHPSGTRLQRVDINIAYCFRYPNDPEEIEVIQPILDALPLLREKGILLVKATKK